MIKRRLEGNKGITLVALVVTIVVLLILAGITITMLFSDNGIINKAQQAANKTAEDSSNTEEGINNLTDQMNGALGEDVSSLGKLIKAGGKVNEDTTVKDKNNKEITIPGGYTVLNITNEVDKGVVIKDDLGNEFVWVPVSSEQLTRMYDSTNKRGNLYNFGTSSAPNNPPTLRTYSSTGLREPDILKDTTNGDASTTAGKGISQLKDVVGITATAGAADENQSILNNWKKELQDKFDEMIKSVERYKGFYIGRYETGSWSNSDNTNIPKVQKGQTVGNATWYYQYMETKNLIKMKDASNNYVDNPNVGASMIWGCQFDRTLEWIAQTNLTEDGKPDYSLLTDSSSWGNHKNYAEVTGDTSTESGKVLPSGTNPNWQKNNIFDLAGNAFDWTIEASDTDLPGSRVARGGDFYNSGSGRPVSNRLDAYPYGSLGSKGSRSTLYIKLNDGSDTP